MAFISKKIEDLVNYRIVEEEKSSRLYLAMSKWLDWSGYVGAAKLWKKYSDEEQLHAEKAYGYLESLDILPIVPALDKPKCDFKTLPEVIKLSHAHELTITAQCNDWAKAAASEGDYMTLALAQWYLMEQAEEIGKISQLMDLVDSFGTSPEALKLLDNHLGSLA